MSSIWTVRRSATDAKLAGLCGGLAAHWNVDPVLVRVGWAVLALSGGIGVVLYLAGWLLIPVEGRQAPVQELFGDAARRWPREVWVALVVAACVLVFAAFGSISPFGVGPAIVIAVIWYFGFYSRRRGAPAAGPAAAPATTQGGAPALPVEQVLPPFATFTGPPTAFSRAAEAWQLRVAEHQGQRTGPSAYAPATEWPSLPATSASAAIGDPAEPGDREQRAYWAAADPVGLYTEPEPALASISRGPRRLATRRLGLVSLLALGLTMSGLAVAGSLGVPVRWPLYAAAALVVVGLGLLAGTWFGRPRGLLALGLVLAATLALAHTPTPTATALGWDGKTVTYRTAAEVPATGTSLDAGHLTVDLSQLVLTGDTTVRAHVDAGELTVIVPRDATVSAHYDLDFGAVQAYGRGVAAGPELTGTIADPGPATPSTRGAAAPTLTLDLSLDAGRLTVRR